jgi:FdhD protein
MRTPGDDTRLVVGFLFSEGLIRSLQDLLTVSYCGRPGEEGYGNVIDITPASGVSISTETLHGMRRGTLTTAACGVCGRRSIRELLEISGVVSKSPTIKRTLIEQSISRLSSFQTMFRQTGGAHAAAILQVEGTMLCGFEDIGRHNAVDKAVGSLLYQEKLSEAVVLVESGRVSFEIVQKAAVAQIPIVISVSAASTLAIDLAKEANITLITFVRDQNFNVYTHPERIEDL